MAENSKIEWTDHTFNPWIGCTKVSPGCANCYADAQDKFRKWTPEGWGMGKPRRRTSVANWKLPIAWNAVAKVRAEYSQGFYARRVFCASLADWLDDEVPIEWLADLLALIHKTLNLDWLLLTKRPQNWKRRLIDAVERVPTNAWVYEWIGGMPPSNVWIGTTVEDQQRADERIPELLRIPARVRFLSCEPLLGEVDIAKWLVPDTGLDYVGANDPLARCVDWVICGGESGHGARPMHPDWARWLRDQCEAAGVPFFFKQWGEYAPSILGSTPYPDGLPASAGFYFDAPHPPGKVWRFGKKAAGRVLDGRTWMEFPTSREGLLRR